MASKIDIISNAFLLIGDQTINSLDEGSFRATVASNLYDAIYENELSSHTWHFCRKLQLLALTTETSPIDHWRYIFQMPTDLLTLIKFDPQIDYALYGDKVYANCNKLTIDYYAKVQEEKLPGYFVKLMEYALAKEFAIAIRENTETASLMNQQYIGQGQKARALESKQRIQRPIQDAPFIAARYDSGYHY